MTKLTRAKVALTALCVLFFLLGAGATAAYGPLITTIVGDRGTDWKERLALSGEQIDREAALKREWNAELELIDREIRTIYGPKIQGVNKHFADRLKNEILTPEQRRLMEEYSTGARRAPRE